MLISDVINSGEYASSMQEVMENLIVKCGKMLPKGTKIQGERILEWKKYTI